MIEIETSYALDDSCEMRLWARGHYPWGAFMDAVEAHLKREDRNDIPRWVYTQAPVTSVYQRCVPCRDSIVSDSMHVYSDKPGRGASPVTVLDFWFPLHRYFQQDADKVDAQPINVRAAHNAIMDGYTKDSNEQFHYMNGYRRAVINERKTDPAMAGDEWLAETHIRLRLLEIAARAFGASPTTKNQIVLANSRNEFIAHIGKQVQPSHTLGGSKEDYTRVFNMGRESLQPASGEDARDANRYRWCRSRRVNFVDDDHATLLIDDDLDAAIDAAMQQERK